MDVEYYMHLSFFPHKRSLPEDFFDKLIGELGWGSVGTFITRIPALSRLDDTIFLLHSGYVSH